MKILQIREWNINNVMAIAAQQIANGGIPLGIAPIVVTKNPQILKESKTLLEELEALDIKPNHSFTVTDSEKLAWAEILNMLRKLPEEDADVSLFSGCHRYAASRIVEAYTGERYSYVRQDFAGTPDEIRKLALQGNVLHELNTKMSRLEQLNAIIPLVKNGVFKRAIDLECMYKHGAATYMFGRAYMVAFQNISVEDAMKVPDREVGRIRNIGKPEEVQAAVELIISGEGIKPSTILKKEQVDALKLCSNVLLQKLCLAIESGELADYRKALTLLDWTLKDVDVSKAVELFSLDMDKITKVIFAEAGEKN
jgi:hypothetical protein